jgi:hypothetical protein
MSRRRSSPSRDRNRRLLSAPANSSALLLLETNALTLTSAWATAYVASTVFMTLPSPTASSAAMLSANR